MDNNTVNNIEETQDTNNINQTSNKKLTLSEELENVQSKWTDNIKDLNDKMKTLSSVDELLNEVYYKRQEAVDLYFGTAKILAKQTISFKTKAAGIYNALKNGSSGIRFTNDNAINLQIESQLSAEKETIDLLTNFRDFMKQTVQTIDNIIYGINNKIKVYEMMNGLKF